MGSLIPHINMKIVNISSRVLGLFLIAMAVEMIINGLKVLILIN